MRWPRALAVALALSAAPQSSAAQSPPSTEARATAQALFDEAMALRKRDDFSGACSKLDESARLDPAPGTKFYLAECLERTGKLASAWMLYTEVADLMANSGQKKRETYARERGAALAPKIGRLRVVVPDGVKLPGLLVRRDAVSVGEGQWGFAAPVDFGSHTIEATAPNMKPFTKTVEVREPGSTLTIELPPWTPLPAPSASANAGSALASAAPSSSEAPASRPLRTAGLLIGAAGLAGLAVGGALGGVALAKQMESNRGPCDEATDVCSTAGLALRSEAITMATGSTIAFIASGVVLAAGVVLVVLPPARAARTALVVRPGGLSLEGKW